MSVDPQHPSFLELDRYVLGAARSPAETAVHIESCDVCKNHLSQVDRDIAIPAWVREAADSSSGSRRWRPRMAWLLGGGFASGLAVAAAVAIFIVKTSSVGPTPSDVEPTITNSDPVLVESVQPGPDTAGSTTTAKGAQAVGLYIKRDQQVFLWDGSVPLVPGDKLRLKVIPGGLEHVAVFSEVPGKKPKERSLVELYAGDLSSKREVILPAAWEVDDSPGSEVLVVALSDTPLTENQIEQLLDTDQRPAKTWIRRLVVAKKPATNPTENQK